MKQRFNFTKFIGPLPPYVTILPNGRMRFSAVAARQIVKDATHLAMYYDAQGFVGIEFIVQGEAAPVECFPIRRVGPNTYADLKPFFDAHDLLRYSTRRCPLERDEESSLYYFKAK